MATFGTATLGPGNGMVMLRIDWNDLKKKRGERRCRNSDSLGFKLAVVTRYSIFVCVVILGPIWLLGTLSGSKMIEGWWYVVYAAELFAVIGGMLFTFSWIMRTWGWLFHRNDPEYIDFLAQGRDPYFYRFEPEDQTPREMSGLERLLNMPGRWANCWNCHRDVQESNYGDLHRNGVICPFCGVTMVSSGSPNDMGGKRSVEPQKS